MNDEIYSTEGKKKQRNENEGELNVIEEHCVKARCVYA